MIEIEEILALRGQNWLGNKTPSFIVIILQGEYKYCMEAAKVLGA